MNLIIYNDIDTYGLEEMTNLTTILLNSSFLHNPSDVDLVNTLPDERYRFVWIISHFTASEIVLKTGKLEISALLLLLKCKEFVFLNGCESLLSLSLISEFLPSTVVLANYKSITSQSAFVFSSVYAKLVVKLDYNFRVAYNEMTKTKQNFGYHLLGSSGTSMSSNDELTKVLYELKTEIALFSQRINTVEKRLENDNLFRVFLYLSNVVMFLMSTFILYLQLAK